MREAYLLELLGSQHDRQGFTCGVPELDRYFRTQAGQDQRANVSSPYVLVQAATGTIVGFYTISAYGVDASDLPPAVTKRTPRYARLPAILLGRLAVDLRFHGQGFGGRLLREALTQADSLSQQLAAVAIIVDAKDDAARSFYERVGFIRFPDQPYRLALAMRTVKTLLSEG